MSETTGTSLNMEEAGRIAAALDEMVRQGYSLVKIGARWSFAVGPRPGDVIRMGHWASPRDALLGLGVAALLPPE